MPSATKKRRMVSYDQNGRMRKDAPEASESTAKKPKVEKESKSIGETREARLAKLSQTVKSSFESDLERIVQDVKDLKGGAYSSFQEGVAWPCCVVWVEGSHAKGEQAWAIVKETRSGRDRTWTPHGTLLRTVSFSSRSMSRKGPWAERRISDYSESQKYYTSILNGHDGSIC